MLKYISSCRNVAAASLVISLLSPTFAAADLINGDFEDGLTGWTVEYGGGRPSFDVRIGHFRN